MFKPTLIGMAALTYKVAQFGPIRKARLQRKFDQKGAELVEKIRAAVPVDKGALRDSIRVEPGKKYPGVLIVAGGTAATARGPTLDEALLTEYGTRKEVAEPYFWPTINNETSAIRSAVADKSDEGRDD
ncbi:HK97 gp10 family phage protein [Lichenihabitans psoromatis]|uniref:HK97 gp10 family phage protein n=1 Tax=Lichenihabitans psoromatis TaxID=2528642 RepID=UPI0010385BA2|nr:HK97 gp10 family phage protein [Lichenihabitans psoromatis]